MKITIELDKELIQRAKKYADENALTLDGLIEAALKSAISSNNSEIKDKSVSGNGLQPGIDLRDWSQIRKMIY